MSNRMLQINELLRQELAGIISREIIFENGLITITKVKCSPDLKKALALISVLPENFSGTALKLLRSKNSLIGRALKENIIIKNTPRLHWQIDEQARYALEIDKVFDKIEAEKNE